MLLIAIFLFIFGLAITLGIELITKRFWKSAIVISYVLAIVVVDVIFVGFVTTKISQWASVNNITKRENIIVPDENNIWLYNKTKSHELLIKDENSVRKELISEYPKKYSGVSYKQTTWSKNFGLLRVSKIHYKWWIYMLTIPTNIDIYEIYLPQNAKTLP